MVIAYWIATTTASLLIAVVQYRRVGLHSITAWFTVLSVILVNVGFFLGYLNYGADETHWSADGVIVTSSGLLTFSVVSALLNQKKPAVESYASIHYGTNIQLYALAVAILGTAWLYFILLGSVPLIDGVAAVFRSGIEGLGQLQASRLARDPYASSQGQRIPLQGLLQVFRTIGAPMVVAYAYIEIRSGASRRPRIVVIALAVITCLAAGQRWPLIYLGVVMAIALGASARKPPYRRLFALGISVIVIGITISALQARTLASLRSLADALLFAITDLIERIFLDQVFVPVLSYGPTGKSFEGMLGDSYIQSLLAYLPGPGVSFSVDFYREVTRDPTGYTATPDFYTEAYINFGLIGTIIASALWALVLSVVTHSVFNSRNSGATARGAIIGAVAALSSYSGVVFTLGVAFVVATAWLVLLSTAPRRVLRHANT